MSRTFEGSPHDVNVSGPESVSLSPTCRENHVRSFKFEVAK